MAWVAREEALSRCQIEHVTNLLARRAHAAATTSHHVCRADALKARWVLAEVSRSIVAPSAALMAFCNSKVTGCSPIRSQVICDELVWDKAVFLQQLSHPATAENDEAEHCSPRVWL
jgi:hypothetical protein